MNVTNSSLYFTFFSKPKPLSTRLSSLSLVEMLSFLDIKEQANCRLLCKEDRKTITNKIQVLAIQKIVQGCQKNSLDQLEYYQRKLNQALYGTRLDLGYVISLDLSYAAIQSSLFSLKANSFLSSLIGEQVPYGTEFLEDEQLTRIIKQFPNLKRLAIHCHTDEMLNHNDTILNQLEALDVYIERPTTECFSLIKTFENLRCLKLDAGWRQPNVIELAALNKLKRFHFSGYMTAEDLQAFRDLKLQCFDAGACEVTSFSAIPNFSQLEHLGINIRWITDEQLSTLRHHEYLQTLSIYSHTDRVVSKDAMKQLLNIKNLKTLKINSRSIDIPLPLDQQIFRCARVGLSTLCSHPLENGLLVGGLAISWPYMGPIYTFVFKTILSLVGGGGAGIYLGAGVADYLREKELINDSKTFKYVVSSSFAIGSALGGVASWKLIEGIAKLALEAKFDDF